VLHAAGKGDVMDKHVCIHGHFYQPPRENPWLEYVELQDSAYPYHDWNARITEECYRQNAASRILGPDKKIIEIVNNYEGISFDFGPTLLYWLESHAPDVYEMVLAADRRSRERFSGHGCAMAQAYNHSVLPLTNTQDKRTQVIWGIEDFKRRFERDPEGMWLPETAADLPTLEVLAEHGIKFTILAPRQAKRVRKLGGGRRWRDVNERDLDTSVPYLCHLPSGKQIALFFYNGPVSHSIAYGGLLHSGENFAARMMESFPRDGEQARLVSVATDGESFGHHHHHGDMALAYCLHHIETDNLATITIYPEYLERFPPEHEVEIWENSSWSCVHGVERWKSNCGCAADQSRSGQQQWRAPLREALDWLRDKMITIYQDRMSAYHPDPWRVRNEYISVINDRSTDNVNNFITRIVGRELDRNNQSTFLKLLEMQRNAMLMYTSCGWFFDNISGIETVQVMMYASRAMQLCDEIQNWNLEPEFKDRLLKAPASRRPLNNGKEIYEAYVEPARVDLHRVGAHFALSSVFEESSEDQTDIYCYSAAIEDFEHLAAGVQVLTSSRARIRSNITLEEYSVDSAVLYLGDHHLFAAVQGRMPDDQFKRVRQDLVKAFRKGDSNEVMRLMTVAFDGKNYSLSHLFKDQQREILNELLESTWEEIEGSFRHIYEHNYAIMQMIRNMNMPLPKALSAPAEFILNQDICAAIQSGEIDLNRLKDLVDEAERLSLSLDRERLSFEGSRRINTLAMLWEESPEDIELLCSIEKALEILHALTPEMDLQHAQNVFFTISKHEYPDMKRKAQATDEKAAEWVKHFGYLAQRLGLAIP
jgi:alpha-amylase/alpha-mannosidase (GH57 family)